MFVFGDVETACGETFPAGRRIRKRLGGERCRQNHKARSSFLHEFGRVLRIQRCHPTMNTRSKIPNQTRLLKIDGTEFHFRTQIAARLTIKLRGWKKSYGGRSDKYRDHNKRDGCHDGGDFEEA